LLSAGTVDGIGQFVVGVPTVEKADSKHRKAIVIPYGDVLKKLYGNAIITRSDMAKDHPDQVKKFTTALLKGLQDTIDDPEGAAKILQKYVPERKVEGSVAELNLMKPYVKPDGFNGPLGAASFDQVESIIKDLEDAKQIAPGAVNPSDVVDRDLAPKG
jgi:NitT/TauT family transport system substrate-binding protein